MPITLTMQDGSQVGMLTKVEMAERYVIEWTDKLMASRGIGSIQTDHNDTLNALTQLKEAHAKLRYERFWAKGGKMKEGQLSL